MNGSEQRRSALEQLGAVMHALGAGSAWPGHSIGLSEIEFGTLDSLIRRAQQHSGWATEENVRFALGAWAQSLAGASLAEWLARYPELQSSEVRPRTIGLILAGNVPLVGLHDVITVFLSGHRARIKCSSQEPELIPALLGVLDHFLPGTSERLITLTGKLGEVDALIATGSDNTARYFDHYFRHVPRIVRKSRVSIAVLDGTETDGQLAALGEDVFRYFGLGCRNVSKLLVPRSFDLDRIFRAFYPWSAIVHHNKYGNNYDYTRALWLLDRVPFLENGFLLMKEDAALASPVAALFYQRYDRKEEALAYIEANQQKIQCVVARDGIAFGEAQHPALSDYADGVDTLRFLLGLG
ncbi:MAG: acyl-CoA reductase [Flavobacteriales bacterium]|jgi:F0F1-type ATP synthase membrane subunit c/vacuolar-type H+-ATPase subunit K|nr:acyl-CoA reductase [Flavobacteriales bacterium]